MQAKIFEFKTIKCTNITKFSIDILEIKIYDTVIS